MSKSCLEKISAVREARGAAFAVLLDPDKLPFDQMKERVQSCENASADFFFVGGSLVHSADTDVFVSELQKYASIPVIGFPGSVSQISGSLDAVLYLSVVSGRNPDFLFGRHLYVAPVIRRLGLESISTAYMLVESGRLTAAQYVNQSLPLPRDKPEIAQATAMAAEMMGMKLMYLDCGSGASESVPTSLISAIHGTCKAPIIVGGGLRSPESVSERVNAGASVIVVGNAIEETADGSFIREMAAAAHTKE